MVDPIDAAGRLLLQNAREQAELDKRRTQAREEGGRLARLILSEIPGALTVRGCGSTWELWRDYRKDSDIDVLVSSYEDEPVPLFDMIDPENELSALFGRKVGVVETESLTNPIRRNIILESREVIHAA